MKGKGTDQKTGLAVWRARLGNLSLAGGLLVAAAPVLKYWLHLFREHAGLLFLGGDFTELIGARGHFYRLLGEGKLALWDPLTCGGMPLAAFVFNLFNPLQLLSVFFLQDGLLRSDFTQTIQVAHLMILGVGGFVLARGLGLGRTAAALLGLSLGSGGFVSAHLLHPDMLRTMAWFPFVFLFLERARRRESPLNAAWAGFFLGLVVLGGHVQVAYYLCLVLGVYAVFWAGVDLNAGLGPARVWSRYWRVFLPLAGAAVLLAAPVVLQMAADAVQGLAKERPLFDSRDFFNTTSGSAQLKSLIFFLFPSLEGGHSETFFNAGLISLLLAGVAVVRLGRPEAAFWKIVLALGVVLSLGGNFGLHKVLLDVLPGFRYFRLPVRFLVLAELALAFLAAYGLNWALSRARAGEAAAIARHLKILWAILFCFLLALTFLGRYRLPIPELTPGTDPLNVLTRALLLTGVAWLFFRRLAAGNGGRAWRLVLIAAVFLDLVFYSWCLNPGAPGDLGRDPSKIPAGQAAETKALAALGQKGPWRFLINEEGFSRQAVYQSRLRLVISPGGYWGRIAPLGYWQVVWGMEKNPRLVNLMAARYLDPNLSRARASRKSWDVVGFSQAAARLERPQMVASLSLEARGDYLGGLAEGTILGRVALARGGRLVAGWPLRLGREIKGGQVWRVRLAQPVEADEVLISSARPRGMLRVASLRVNGAAVADRLRLRPWGKGLAINPDALPMAFFASRAAVVEKPGSYQAALASVDPSRCVIFRKPPRGFAAPAGPNPAAGGDVKVESWKDGDIRLAVKAATAGWLVMSQANFAGWRATLDGWPAPIENAFGYMVALRVPAGEHRISLVYRAPWILAGALLSLFSFLGLLGLTWRLKRRRV